MSSQFVEIADLGLGRLAQDDEASTIAGAVAIETHGCKLNQADSAVLARQFARFGYGLVDDHADADIIVVNTCTVTATADSKARQALRAARRSNPDAIRRCGRLLPPARGGRTARHARSFARCRQRG